MLATKSLSTGLGLLTLSVLIGLNANARTPVDSQNRNQLTEQGIVVCPDMSALWDQPRRDERTYSYGGAVPAVAHSAMPTLSAPPPAPAPVPAHAQAMATRHAAADMAKMAPSYHPFVQPMPARNTENYKHFKDNAVTRTADNPISTFSIDVDTGSYANVRRMICGGDMVHADSVRVEEFLNYFRYDRNEPRTATNPFAVTTEYAPAPWDSGRQLMMIGVKGYAPRNRVTPPANLVFLIDTSGSMQSTDKLPLVKYSLKQLAQKLRPQDTISIVAYAGSAGLVLPATSGSKKSTIIAALDRLEAGGSTNGGQGLELAYKVAKQHYKEGAANRVILASDGDFNVGNFDTEMLKSFVGEQRKSGIALTTLGFGRGNYNDEMAEQLADVGNGRHAYIDSPLEAQRVMHDEMNSVLQTIAQDMKIQIEFNPMQIAEYRLIGYENRVLDEADFSNDHVDAGEVGAGQQVTAIYELTPVGSGSAQTAPRRYGETAPVQGKPSREIANISIRYKLPGHSQSTLTSQPVTVNQLKAPSESLRFASAVIGFADLLRGGTHIGNWGWQEVIATANRAIGSDSDGTRRQFVGLAKLAAERNGVEDRE